VSEHTGQVCIKYQVLNRSLPQHTLPKVGLFGRISGGAGGVRHGSGHWGVGTDEIKNETINETKRKGPKVMTENRNAEGPRTRTATRGNSK